MKFAVPERPLILIVDGHKSHENIELIDCARTNNVILLCLPPHTTHALQPLDVSVFKSLKSHFSKALRAWCFTKRDFVVTKRDFARVVKEPYESAFSIAYIKSGFAKCGIFPLNRRAIPQLKLLPSELNNPCSSVSRNVCNVATSPMPDENEASSELVDESMSNIAVASSNVDRNIETPSTDYSEIENQICSSPALSSRPATISSNTVSFVSTPTSSNSTLASPLSNSLVMAGLVPQNLADILSTSGCEDVQRKPKRRVFKARVLTEQEFYETLKDKEAKELEMEAQKERRRIEREQKRKEREQKRKEREQKRKEREEKEKKRKEQRAGKRKQGQRKRKRSPTPSCSDVEDEDQPGRSSRSKSPTSSSSEVDDQPRTSSRRIQVPARYRYDESDSESSDGNESDTICDECQSRDPVGYDGRNIFWINCCKCQRWYHVFCVCGRNYAKKKFVCEMLNLTFQNTFFNHF